jgi:tetratricopeptide (TPR) repeat protein
MLLTSCHIPRISVLSDPLSPEEHINLGLAYEKEGDIENAVAEYTKASKSLPIANLYIANLYFIQDELEKAEYYYKEAIRKNKNIGDAYNNLAWLYYIKGENLAEAEQLAEKAIIAQPEKKTHYQDTIQAIRKLKKLKYNK